MRNSLKNLTEIWKFLFKLAVPNILLATNPVSLSLSFDEEMELKKVTVHASLSLSPTWLNILRRKLFHYAES